MFVVIVELIQERQIIQLKPVKGVKQFCADLHAVISSLSIPEREIVVGLLRICANRENVIGIVFVPAPLRAGINIVWMLTIHCCFLLSF